MTENHAQIRFVRETTFGTEPGRRIEPRPTPGTKVVPAVFCATIPCERLSCEGYIEAEFEGAVTRLLGVKCSRCEATYTVERGSG